MLTDHDDYFTLCSVKSECSLEMFQGFKGSLAAKNRGKGRRMEEEIKTLDLWGIFQNAD